MDPRIHPDPHISFPDGEHRTPPVLSPSPVITPTKSKSRGLLADLAGWPSYSDMRIQAPGGETSSGLDGLTSKTLPGVIPALGASHLPTPQSPGNMASYLLTRTPTAAQNNLHPDHDSNALPTEFRSYISSPPTPFRPHLIPTPGPSPLVARSRNNGAPSLARTNSHDDNSSMTQGKRDGSRSRASTPPHTPSQLSRPVTPVLKPRPTTPLQWRSTGRSLPESSHLDNSTTSITSPIIKDEPGADVAQLIENIPEAAHITELHRPGYFKRMRHLAPSSSTAAGGASLTSDMGGKDRSLLWSSGNAGVIDSSNKGKRIALFQETSEESFEESLMAGGYGRYRSDGPLWKVDQDEEAPDPLGVVMGEGGHNPGLELTEEEKRKKTRLAAFFDRARVSTATAQLLPVEVEGCGRVLMRVEPSEPQTPPKPTPKAKRSRKRKKLSADVKPDVDKDSIAGSEARAVDGPNWPDAEFPWRSRFLTADGLSGAEREERLRCIENFFDRESNEDDVDDDRSSGRHSPEEVALRRSPRSSGGKMFPLVTHSKDHRRGLTVSVIPSDPADAKTALLSKKSIRAVQLRLLRRRGADRSDEAELLCICRGPDDGRPLVQCDACRTWYHLECIGIQSTSELGREEDPWFCANCVEVKTPPPFGVSLLGPTLGLTDDDEHDPFLNTGLHPSPATAWTMSVRPPRTPPRTQRAPPAVSGSSWDEPPSSSSRGDPRTPRFNAASAFGDMVRVYGTTPGRLLEPPQPTSDESPFDPTSTPSRGIMFGLPFTTPRDGRWGLQGVRGGQDMFYTPKRTGEDGSTASVRYHGQYPGRVGEVSEEGPFWAQGLSCMVGANNVTPVEREMGGARRVEVMESPLGAKRVRRMAGS